MGGGELGGVSCRGKGVWSIITHGATVWLHSIPVALCSGVECGQSLRRAPPPSTHVSGTSPDSILPHPPEHENLAGKNFAQVTTKFHARVTNACIMCIES